MCEGSNGGGAPDSWARGEMRRPWQDERRRRQCAMTSAVIKDEGQRIEID
jgi:hypothetical protein